MELARATHRGRGVGAWLAIGTSPLPVGALAFWVYIVASDGRSPEVADVLMLVSIIVVSWLLLYIWKMDVEAPVDEPIRFNRARSKIYVYRFRHNGLKPFNKYEWGVTTESYDWADLRAEFCSTYGPMGTGGALRFVTLAVLEPGSQRIRDRFVFAHGRQEGEMYWAMAQLYMQQGPEAVPKFDRPPRDWNNEVHFENIARRFAPKVKWPEAMDLESRTAP
ncbi:DUF6708 domain-containing protein [Pseudomonas sp. HR96]|uniref:DUF6708 domain-containing protein n=1 Tax=Pseudomonas sp. HR96 TaxID=1027966 RepID=UPI002A74B525|nr:DUF6708 domain-containing protein [Pseudomonas sp. HR96]WPO98920.1 DUF6708 domain-containing protein [Pseudomonas sp. HR96]